MGASLSKLIQDIMSLMSDVIHQVNYPPTCVLAKDAIACGRAFFFIIHYGCGKGNTNHKVLKHGD